MKKWLLSICEFLILALLPVVPILRAAVIPDPFYRKVWVSLWQIARYILFPMPGLQYRFAWYSWVVIILIFGIGFLVQRLVSKNFA